jgi:hypothetical protein
LYSVVTQSVPTAQLPGDGAHLQGLPLTGAVADGEQEDVAALKHWLPYSVGRQIEF